MAERAKLQIVFYALEGAGATNSCIGLAQALLRRGHRITFYASNFLEARYTKLGFKVMILRKKNEITDTVNANPAATMVDGLLESPILTNTSPLKKLIASLGVKGSTQFMGKLFEEIAEAHEQIKDALETQQPDVIIVDHCLIPPCIVHGDIPWCFICSSNPLGLYNSKKLPPCFGGLPCDDPSEWEPFRTTLESLYKPTELDFQNKLYKHLNYPEVERTGFYITSPHLNIYGFPEELDYREVTPLPDNYLNVDAFCRESSQEFSLPKEFLASVKKGEKLVYFSLGSMGSIDVGMMKRIVSVLANSPHKFIVSKGLLHDQFELANNMWGEAFLPQTEILPLVDLVITHGGNNSLTETFTFGKPMIVMPLFFDQYDNAQRVKEKCFGFRIDPYNFADQKLLDTIELALGDENLRLKMQAVAKRIKQSKNKEKACIAIENLAAKKLSLNRSTKVF